MLKSILTVTCAALLSCPVFAGGGTAVPSAAHDPYVGNLVRLSKIKVDPAQIEAYKTYAAEVGRESMKREPGVRVLYSIQEKKGSDAVLHSGNLCRSRGLSTAYSDPTFSEIQAGHLEDGQRA